MKRKNRNMKRETGKKERKNVELKCSDTDGKML